MEDRVDESAGNGATERNALAAAHLRLGWWSLLAFLSFGAVLEAMHGLKVPFYLDVSNETRRLLWTLAHAHGVLLSLVHVVFAATLRAFPLEAERLAAASRCLMAAGLLLPGGFFLGGLFVYGGDPSLGVALTPIGAALLFFAVLRIAQAAQALR